MSKPPIIRVEWIDTKGISNEWEMIDGIDPMLPCKCVSVGFLVDDHADYKTLAMTHAGDQVLGRMTIPTVAITEMMTIIH